MTITNGYTTLATVRSLLGIPATDTSGDTLIEASIEGVSRQIDDYTGRRFYASSETRYFDPVDGDDVFTDDIISITTLKTDDNGDGTYETTWTTSDYQLLPYSAALQNKPYTHIQTSGYGSYSFPYSVKKCIQIVGSFGYCAIGNIPKQVVEACKLQSVRMHKRKDAPFGVIGGGEMSQPISLPELDADVKLLLAPFVRRV